MIIECNIKSIESLAENTYKILLTPQQPMAYKAGQYLMVVMGEKDKRPFSIASSPCRKENELELHIGASEDNAYAMDVVKAMQAAYQGKGTVQIDAPHGEAYLQSEQESSILLVAGGTGFSYVRSILDHCISQKVQQPIYLYWGAKESQQLYALDELHNIAKQYPYLHFIPVIENAEANWTGKNGNVLEAINADFESLEGFDIYIAGRFEMAGAARTQFTQDKGAQVERMFADAYAFI